MREVSLVVHHDLVKKKLVEIFKDEIVASIPERMRKNKGEIVPVL
jgi:LysR family hydrogen peroxide-inducible transcriptional activator